MINLLYNIIIFPIYLFIDIVFKFVTEMVQYDGFLTLFFMSIVINLVTLPLFLKAEKIQKNNSLKQKELFPKIKEIKRIFKGKEQFYVLNTFYRQNNYHPLFALKSLTTLFLIIPFFIGAYVLLSNKTLLSNLFMPAFLWNYGFSYLKPDNFLNLFGYKINILPIIMTLINLISSFLYTKCNSIFDRIQLIVTPLIFLILLYNAPAGLVIYWIFNNLFYLFKNLILDNKNFNFYIRILKYAILVCLLLLFLTSSENILWKIFILALITLFAIIYNLSKYLFNSLKENFYNSKSINTIFVLTCISFVFVFGALNPTNIISSDVFTFMMFDIKSFFINIFTISIGCFALWPIYVYFSTLNPQQKFAFTGFSVGLLFGAIYELFVSTKINFGTLSANFNFEYSDFTLYGSAYDFCNVFLDFIVYLLIMFLVLLLLKKQKTKILITLLSVILASLLSVSLYNIYKIAIDYNNIKNSNDTQNIDFKINLSQTEPNVIIIMLDRSVGVYLPHILKDIPDIKKSFNGFTYYPNTLSYATQTIIAYPALIGGYEYTPQNINSSQNSIEDTYNQSLLVLPKLYKENGYNISLLDMPWAGFKDIYDKDFYKQNGIENDYNLFSRIYCKNKNKIPSKISFNNSIYFTTMMVSPKCIKDFIYKLFMDKDAYNDVDNLTFNSSIEMFDLLPKLINNKSKNKSFVVINSMITHGKIPDNILKKYADNLKENFYTNSFEGEAEKEEYNANLVAFIKLAALFDYLKSNNLYDNSKIIIVSDHGSCFISQRKTKNIENYMYHYNPLLMVKDINQKETLNVSYKFMTNADVPYLATKNLIKNAKNPYTKKEFRESIGGEIHQLVIPNHHYWHPSHFFKLKKLYTDVDTYTFKGNDIFIKTNWSK